MKKTGLVGGLSWVSTLDYYKFINEGVNQRLGGLNAAELVMYSLNFADIQAAGWPNAYNILLNACETLKQSGVSAIALCSNTPHMYADQLEQAIQLPFINIITETAKQIQAAGIQTVGLMGTQFTMEMDFYRKKLEASGLTVLIPEPQATRNYMQDVLRDELGKGIVTNTAKEKFIAIAHELISKGAQGIILGCTEIPLVITPNDLSVPQFDTTKIHSQAIVDYMVS